MRAYGGVNIDAAPYFTSINQEILSVQLNLKSEEGMALLKRLIGECDVLIDNLRPGAMERSKIDFAHLQAIKPDLIQCSIKMWGSDGPYGYQTGYAPSFAALSGLNYLVGHEGETPRGMNIRYGDSTVGAWAALAILAALHHRESTGEGQFIDVSAVEGLSAMVGDSLLAYAMTGEVPQPDGNAHPDMAPHGTFPCADEGWLSLAVADDAEWQACAAVLGGDLAKDPRFASNAGRLVNRSALESAICALTRPQAAGPLAGKLRAAGVPAFPSMSSLDLVSDSFHWNRGGYRMVEQAGMGPRPIIGPAWRMSPDEAAIERGAPLLGEHNGYVYRDILGLSQAELDDLMARKIVD
jgi:crotonobetainyl-CoA:carnitine CoA-transferase CaiB-like acyl-CoA transferase